MKKYMLKVDIPFARAGDMVEMWSDGTMAFVDSPALPRFNKKDVRMFTTWFEEIKELEWIYCIDSFGSKVVEVKAEHILDIRTIKSIGNYFETKEEAEACLKYLKAKEVIKQDAKGFKPDWSNCEHKFCGVWDLLGNELFFHPIMTSKQSTIYFRTKEDIEESLKKHPEEWRKYLFYEQ